MINNDNQWFTEQCQEGGSAFCLSIKSKLHEEKTAYQTISIYDTHYYGKLMVIDGFTMLSSLDNFLYHEMMSHPAIFTHPAPKKAVIIGGGDCGTLKEVLKHPDIEAAWLAEIDERVTRLSEQYFPELCTSNQDPRAHFHFGDGIKFIEDAQAGSLDLIIIDSTDPIGPAEGLFSQGFYEKCYRALGDQGILVQQSESPLYHLDSIIYKMRQDMLNAGFSNSATLQFPQPLYPSGWWTCTMAGKNIDLKSFRRDDALNKSFTTDYYNADIHQGALALPEFMRRRFA